MLRSQSIGYRGQHHLEHALRPQEGAAFLDFAPDLKSAAFLDFAPDLKSAVLHPEAFQILDLPRSR
jgi:hypothetical protein